MGTGEATLDEANVERVSTASRPWLRRDELALLAVALLSAVACLATGTGFSFWRVFKVYAEFFALYYMVVFMATRLGYGIVRSDGSGGARAWLQEHVLRYRGPDDVLRPDREMVRGGLCFLLALTAYTNVKVRVPVLNATVTDSAFAAMDRALFGTDFVWLGRAVVANPAWDGLLMRIYLHDYLFIAAAALVLHLRRDHQALRVLFIASGFVYLIGIWWTVALPNYGPCFVDAANWRWLSTHTVGGFQETLARGMADAVAAGQAGREIRVNAFSGAAAFPSLHVGHMALVGMLCWQSRGARWLGIVIAVATLATAVATVAYGWHYLVDTPGGLLIAWAALHVTRKLIASDPEPAQRAS
ncbi:MAG: phosphatase PAP2 family protein [Myxococcales bacterium]|nr:phosphatase PAP2 family protein [Myxococcales bacterium]